MVEAHSLHHLHEFYYQIFQSFCAFTICYITIHYLIFPLLLPKIQNNIKSRFYTSNSFTSFLHSSTVVYLVTTSINGGTLILSTNQEISSLTSETTYNQRYIGAISIGYFTYDTIALVINEWYYFKKFDTLMIIHHIISVITMIIAITSNYGGFVISHGTFLCEISHPLFHLNGIRKWTSKHNCTLIDLISQYLFVVIFMLARFVFGSYFIIQLYIYNVLLTMRILCTFMFVLSGLWIPSLIKFSIKQFKKYKKYSININDNSNDKKDIETKRVLLTGNNNNDGGRQRRNAEW